MQKKQKSKWKEFPKCKRKKEGEGRKEGRRKMERKKGEEKISFLVTSSIKMKK